MTDLDDIRWLLGSDAARLLDGAEAGKAPLHTQAATLRRDLSAERTHLILEQIELRRRAEKKFRNARRMFFTRVGLEQATDEAVASYKAGRMPADVPLADLCCGIGGDLMAIAGRGPTRAVDRDAATALIAEANCRAAGVSVDVHVADVVETSLGDVAAWHIDPDRRPAGRRTTRVELHEPSPEVVNRLLVANPHAAIKLAPAATFPESFCEGELEWISRDRECRQLAVWRGALARRPGRRCATVLNSGDGAPRTVCGTEDEVIPVSGEPNRFVVEPDPAVLAARLTGAIAAEYDLAAIAPGVAYLTTDRAIRDAALAVFEVIDVVPFHARKLKRLLAERQIGRLEVKKRGVPHDPAVLAKQLRGRGDESATLLLFQVDGVVTAILARRITWAN